MAQHMVGIRQGSKEKLRRLARKKRVSQQGLLSALVEMACGETELGIIDLDWDAIRKKYPNQRQIQKRSWQAVVAAVQQLMQETEDPEQIAMRSRFTLAQVKRAMKELGYYV